MAGDQKPEAVLEVLPGCGVVPVECFDAISDVLQIELERSLSFLQELETYRKMSVEKLLCCPSSSRCRPTSSSIFGSSVLPSLSAKMVWKDTDRDGVQDAGEPGTSSAASRDNGSIEVEHLPKPMRTERYEQLTKTELSVLEVLVTGTTPPRIGEPLFIAENTVKLHVRNIYRKLWMSGRTDAITQALQRRLVVQNREGRSTVSSGEDCKEEQPWLSMEDPLLLGRRGGALRAVSTVVE